MKINKALSVLSQLFRSVVEHPILMAGSAKGLAYNLRGTNFGRAAGSTGVSHREIKELSTQNPLSLYFASHTTGPGIWKWMHYFDIYHRHFKKFIGRDVNVLEIGIYSGGSLQMWKEYFGEKAHIYGVDIEEACQVYE